MIRSGGVRLILDEAALDALVNSPAGPVAKHLGRIGAKVEGTAKQLLSGSLVNVDGGQLRSGTKWAFIVRNNKLGIVVASSAPYAKVVHDGGTFQVRSHSRSRGGKSHNVRSHKRTVVGRPYLIKAAQANGLNIQRKA